MPVKHCHPRQIHRATGARLQCKSKINPISSAWPLAITERLQESRVSVHPLLQGEILPHKAPFPNSHCQKQLWVRKVQALTTQTFQVVEMGTGCPLALSPSRDLCRSGHPQHPPYPSCRGCRLSHPALPAAHSPRPLCSAPSFPSPP